MADEEIVDKHGNTIHEGDYVFTKIRGGTHEGKVEAIVTGQRAEEESVKHPPKVLLQNKDGRIVPHNPETLEVRSGDTAKS